MMGRAGRRTTSLRWVVIGTAMTIGATGCLHRGAHEDVTGPCSIPLVTSRARWTASRDSGVISGRVFGIDANDPNHPRALDVALVRITSPRQMSAPTDTAGRFALKPLPPGRYVVQVLRIGYPKRTDTLTVLSGRRGLSGEVSLYSALIARCCPPPNQPPGTQFICM